MKPEKGEVEKLREKFTRIVETLCCSHRTLYAGDRREKLKADSVEAALKDLIVLAFGKVPTQAELPLAKEG